MVSVIIPVYNSGDFLNKCLDSVVEQTYRELEIILVNDGSSNEHTAVLLNNWTHKDDRIRLINKTHNEGIEKARYTGLAHAKGDYLMFMDHDDWLVDKGVIEVMMKDMLTTGADVVMGRSYEQRVFFRKPLYDPTPVGIITQPELKDKYYISFFGVNIIPVLVWGKLYKMDVIRRAKLKACGLRDTDDVAFNMWLFPFVTKLSVIDKFVYVHRWGGFSTKLIDFIPEYKKLYMERRAAMYEFDYEKALKSINVQMKNLLSFDLSLKIERKHYKKSEAIRYLKDELMDDFWDQVMVPNDESPFMQALRMKDYVLMYNIVNKPLSKPGRRVLGLVKMIGRWVMRFL